MVQLTILNDVGDVQYLRWQNTRIHLKVFSESWHLNDQTRRHLLQLDVRRQERLFKELLNCRQTQLFVFFNKQLIEECIQSGTQLKERKGLMNQDHNEECTKVTFKNGSARKICAKRLFKNSSGSFSSLIKPLTELNLSSS